MAEKKTKYDELITQIDALYHEALALEKKFSPAIKKVHPHFRKSAKNLLHYLALRQHDIRELQEKLAQLGLSSLGQAEGHVLASLMAVRSHLCHLAVCPPVNKQLSVSYFENTKLLTKHTQSLLGPVPQNRTTRIMVTFSTDLAKDYDLVIRMLKAGMNCARINCAHDDEATWQAMVRNIRKAEKETGLPCTILFDLMGPKLRTGELKEGPKVIAIRPAHNELGLVASPAVVWLTGSDATPPHAVDATLPVEKSWVKQLQEGDQVNFKDTRGRKRTLSVIQKEKKGVVAHLLKTSYIATGTKLIVKNKTVASNTTIVGDLPATEIPILLKKDHFIVLHRASEPGEPAQFDANGHIIKPAHISCTLPEVFDLVKEGEPVLFDDGKIEGVITEVKKDELLVKITFAKDAGSLLRADKGINLPESNMLLNDLTAKDKQDVQFISKHADIVNLSFANHPSMVQALFTEIKKHKANKLAVMLKIETKESFKNLPYLLLTAMQSYPAGIMIARGDLAVECGWQRLAEVQEEILWLCEASHMPVVWATQVLETLAKKGRPSRAEITDAAMAQRADCVMLNKGPHIIEAITMLHDIMHRMQDHQHKKTSMLRSLHVSELTDE